MERFPSEADKDIMKMSKQDFRIKILRGVAQTSEFAHLINYGLGEMTDEENDSLIKKLKECGIKVKRKEDLENICLSIAKRTFSYT